MATGQALLDRLLLLLTDELWLLLTGLEVLRLPLGPWEPLEL